MGKTASIKEKLADITKKAIKEQEDNVKAPRINRGILIEIFLTTNSIQ